ncbi:hypothetical protein CN134_22990 [Sinorhizobium meliloti]|nr:hypothetical protein CN134_22990 [Sinorhizobium meliloti]RVO27447.1 hypothetical protein CN098_23485 [Sinorhizobium meliloti]
MSFRTLPEPTLCARQGKHPISTRDVVGSGLPIGRAGLVWLLQVLGRADCDAESSLYRIACVRRCLPQVVPTVGRRSGASRLRRIDTSSGCPESRPAGFLSQ